MLSIRTHLVMMILAQLGGGFVGAFAGVLIGFMALISLGLSSDSDLLTLLFLGGGAFAGFFGMRKLFRGLIPARCARETCSGTAKCVGSMPISYECRSCGHVHATTFYEGGK